MAKKKKTSQLLDTLFSDGVFADTGSFDSDTPATEQARMLALLENGPKHPDWLRGVFDGPEKLINKLRAAGHIIRRVTLANRRWDWVYALSRKGKYVGIKEGEDPKIAH